MPARTVYCTGQVGTKAALTGDPRPPAFVFYANLSPPPFMEVTFIMLHGGSEELVIHADERTELDEVLAEIKTHPRLRRWHIADETGKILEEGKRGDHLL